MPLSLEQAVGQKLMLSFVGTEPTDDILETLQQHVGGITLFRPLNVANPSQVRALADSLQAAAQANGQPPLLIAADHEGGTLLTFTSTTPFPGNLALGATRSPDLANRTGYAIGRELAAMGINVNYAPVCDINLNTQNLAVGPRSFGDDPLEVAALSSAMVRGLQLAGVAATPKHFPGLGAAASDPHFGTPVLQYDAARLQEVELPPFVAGIQAGAKLVMTAHVALPGYNDGAHIPATLSPPILRGLLRGQLKFDGVIISDAMDMKAIHQGDGFLNDVVAASVAGVDLLLLTTASPVYEIVHDALIQAVRRAQLASSDVMASAERILALKAWCAAQARPSLDVVACPEHQALAAEVAERSITLVRNRLNQIPLHLPPDARIAVVVPQPQDLTPADTSSYDIPAIAQAFRAYHSAVDEFIVPIDPTDSETSACLARAGSYDLIIVGTINATGYPGQAKLVNALLECGTPTVVVPLRMPYDVQLFPRAQTVICSYSIQPPSIRALARALWGDIPFVGQLPVKIQE